MARSENLEGEHHDQICMFPRSNPVRGKQLGELKHVRIQMPLHSSVQKFIREHSTSVSSLFVVSWGLLLRSYTNAEKPIFGYVNKTSQLFSARHNAQTSISACHLDIDNTIATLDLLHQVDAGYYYQVHNVASPTDAESRSNEGYNSLVVLTHKKSTSLGFGAENQRNFEIMVIIEIDEHTVEASLAFSTSVICHEQALTVAATLEHIIEGIVRDPSGNLGDISLCSDRDIALLQRRNKQIPERSFSCIQDIVSQQVREYPANPAISSWDGDCTYGELDHLSSGLVAHLSSLDIGPGSFVPLCFEKSKWTVIAILGVIKAGAAYVLMDPSYPHERMHSICRDLDARVVITSQKCYDFAEKLANQVVVVDDAAAQWKQGRGCFEVKAASSDALYAVFTSGTTGKPKGVAIEHGAFYARAMANIPALALDRTSRVLQFSSYAFQISNRDILLTLMCGGCICIPSESDRLNKLDSFIDHHNVNWACLTSSVVDLLNPETVPSLKILVMGGEAMSLKNVSTWANKVRLINAYGSSECCGVNSTHPQMTLDSESTNIGSGVGSVLWIVDARDHHKLAPIGAIGELLIESAALARGYIKDDRNTKASFLKNLEWIKQFRHGTPQRLYRTGDLARYNMDGTLSFMGRKDDQVKIHGQRVELAEIEHHMDRSVADFDMDGTKGIQAVVDVVTPSDRDRPVLVAFLCMGFSEDKSGSDFDATMRQLAAGLAKRLEMVLPSYMLPSAYVMLEQIPMTLSGKKNRRRLREQGASMTWEQMSALSPAPSEYLRPQSIMEHHIQRLLATVLNLQAESISMNDNFFRIGGDSIMAMRLVGMARKERLSLTVADIFRHPRIANLAEQATTETAEAGQTITSFSLLRTHIDISEARRQAASLCRIDLHDVEDIFPCTPLQEGLLALTAKRTGDYTIRRVLELNHDIKKGRLRQIWQEIITSTPMLRTRIVDLPEQGLVQVIVKEPFYWITGTNLNAYLEKDEGKPMEMGTPLSRFGIVEDDRTSRHYLVWTIHHALFDLWSMNLLDEALESAYRGREWEPLIPFNPLVKYVAGLDEGIVKSFWQDYFAGSEAAVFPPLPSPAHHPRGDSTLKHTMSGLDWSGSDITASTTIRAAWAFLQARHTNASDVVFGATVTGRQAAVPGVERMAGPTIATVPVRVRLENGDQSVSALLQHMQNQAVDMIPFEQLGLQSIRRVSEEAEQGCQFQTLLVVQPAEQPQLMEPLFTQTKDVTDSYETNGIDPFATYAIMLVCYMGRHGLELRISFDSAVIEEALVQRMVGQFEHLLRQLLHVQKNESMTIKQIEAVSDKDLRDIWTWNATIPKSEQVCVHDLIAETARKQPNVQAVDSWDGQLTYGELEELSTKLAYRLIRQGLRPNDVVPLCFEKSFWTPVAMLAVMKAGGTSVAMDSTLPEERLRGIVNRIKPELIVSSVANKALASRLVPSRVTTVGPSLIEHRDLDALRVFLPALDASTPLLILFTSGSTGVPKGAIITHSSFATAIKYQAASFGIAPGERIFDFASYSFDIAWFNALQSFACGACLCIPSESDRRNDLQGSIVRSKSTVLFLTPSVARLLEPSSCPSVKCIALGGEPQMWSDFESWPATCKRLTVYGPAECTVVATAADARIHQIRDMSIGPGLATNTWILDPNDGHQLVPVGTVGELWLEGPLVGSGYFNDPDKTAAAFVENPPWLLSGGPDQPGRCGRLYKTGDLMRYGADGTMIFMGRKDTQVKIRGQRVELAEVEHYVRHGLEDDMMGDLVAECVLPQGSKTSILVVFVAPRDPANASSDDLRERLLQRAEGLQEQMANQVPPYMIPTAYIPVDSIPMTATGKTDRRRLREIGGSLTLDQVAALKPLSREWLPPTTKMERQLHQLWVAILGIEPSNVSVDDSFLRIGGDSISAMRLVGAAREQGLSFTVTDLFKQPRLRDLAKIIKSQNYQGVIKTEPYSLLRTALTVDGARARAAIECNVNVEQIEDIFPCTPLQEGLIAMTTKQAGAYVAKTKFELHDYVELDRFRKAWQEVVTNTPILRTRIINLPEQGLVQVVVNELIQWKVGCNGLAMHLKQEQEPEVGLRTPLALFSTVEETDKSKRFFIWTVHHALYDGWSLPLIFKEVQAAYWGRPLGQTIPFQSFVKQVIEMDQEDLCNYWKAQFSDCEAVVYPTLPYVSYQPQADQLVKHQVTGLRWPLGDITASTTVRAAWSLLAARYTDSSDVVFGATVTGRQIAVPGVERMLGPTIVTVPVRVVLDWNTTVKDLLQCVQTQALEMTKFEQTGLQRIRHISSEADRGSQFQTLLVIQPKIKENNIDKSEKLFHSTNAEDGIATHLKVFNTYAMMVICQLEDSGLNLQISFDSNVISAMQVRRTAEQLESILRQISLESNNILRLADVNLMTEQDLHDIWSSNATVPETLNRCVHDLITDRARDQAETKAIYAWDGELTYGELHTLSTRLAHNLVKLGVVNGQTVPLRFEKSMWVPVAMLGVMLAGCAPLLFSSSVPRSRISQIMSVARPQLALVSQTQLESFGDIIPTYRIADLLSYSTETTEKSALPQVHTSGIAMTIFTSGSTGVPKGVFSSHRSLAANVDGVRKAFQIGPDSRVFQFASYDFDVSVLETYACLASGGCLCIPSEAQRFEDLSLAIRTLHANWVCLTPSTAETISPDTTPSLQNLVFAGEPLREEVVRRWMGTVSVFNWYGPAECSFAAFCPVIPGQWFSGLIGSSSSGVSWVVQTSDLDALAPVGTVGELLIEGYILADGYLNDPERTAAAFIDNPSWLVRGSAGHKGRQGRLYRTGDLVRSTAEGNLVFIGRKDSQVKIRGQRVELGEVELHVRQLLQELHSASAPVSIQVVAEVVTPKTSDRPTLVAFVHIDGGAAQTHEEVKVSLRQLTASLEDRLTEVLPAYMVPGTLILVDEIPITVTGKTDRRRLRENAASMTQEQWDTLQPSSQGKIHRAPVSAAEHQLQRLWAVILQREAENISIDDNFFRLGGDSITAIRLVGAARDQGLSLTVADVFRYPRLCNLAKTISTSITDTNQTITAFSLLTPPFDESVRQEAATLCGIETSQVEDIYPCTPLQEGLLALTAKRSGDYTATRVRKLQNTSIQLDRLHEIWEEIIEKTPILRTRIVNLSRQGLVQVVVDEPFRWTASSDLDTYLNDEERRPMEMGTPLARFGIVVDGSHRYFLWTIHHALYDGWSTNLLDDAVESLYRGHTGPLLRPFVLFVKHIAEIDDGSLLSFWREYFAGSNAVVFPALPSSTYSPCADSKFDYQVEGLDWAGAGGITPSTAFQVAWAILLARYTNTSDVVFGSTVTGRQVAVPGVEHIAGPTIATVPVRVVFDWEKSVQGLLQQVQNGAIEVVPFEQVGLQRIRRISEEAEQGCRFQTLLVIQPKEEENREVNPLFSRSVDALNKRDPNRVTSFTTYAMMIVCQLDNQGLQLRISFDSQVIEESQVKRMAAQLERVLHQVCKANQSAKIKEIETVSDNDLHDIWKWNLAVPEAVETCIHDLITLRAREQPEKVAVHAWDGELTYRKLDELSTRLAYRLVELGVGPSGEGAIVPLCFEKSMWTSVAMLAVMKAGGASVAMDVAQPEERLRTVVQQVNAPLIISSAASDSLARRLSNLVVVANESHISRIPLPAVGQLPKVHPSNKLYIVFTSGSTGTPKGAIVTHSSFASAVKYQQTLSGFKSDSRVFDFASYAFDAAWFNALQAFTVGGCLCVPSDEDRQDLAASMLRFKASIADLTPTLSRLLCDENLPDLKTLYLAGEALQAEQVEAWKGRVQIINAYGPSECTPTATLAQIDTITDKNISIGSGLGLCTWVVNPEHGESLTAVGGVGELWLEGPLVGQGYLNDPKKTAAAFVKDPPWLVRGGPGFSGRRGRLYKTGDLVKYKHNGTLAFFGRKDMQVKIRGQRVELGEVEYYIRRVASDLYPHRTASIEVVAEVVTPEDTDQPTLVAFISVIDKKTHTQDHKAALRKIRPILVNRLAEVMPVYMVPTGLILIDKIPVTATGKTDRRRLQQKAASMTREQLSNMVSSRRQYRAPQTAVERQLQGLWATILQKKAEDIGLDENFFRIGGDSIAAMRLVGVAREQSLSITVADIFRYPHLVNLAEQAKIENTSASRANTEAFSLLKSPMEKIEVRRQTAELCDVPTNNVQDVLPCTPLQEGLLALTARRHNDYTARRVLRLELSVQLDQFKAAWNKVIASTPILRTRIVDLPGQGLVQAVLHEPFQWKESTDLQAYISEDSLSPMELGVCLTRFGIINDYKTKRLYLVWTIHHALFDGWSMKLIDEAVENTYRDRSTLPLLPFIRFVKHVARNDEEMAGYWRQYFARCEAVVFPSLPSPRYHPQADRIYNHRIDGLKWNGNGGGTTISAAIRAAWAILVAQYTNAGDVVFGTILTGRQAAIPEVERIVGPTIATVPIRVTLDFDETTEALLRRVQEQAVDMIQFEQLGLQRIRRVSEEAEQACGFQTLVVVQPMEEQRPQAESLFEAWATQSKDISGNSEMRGLDAFTTYAVTLLCQLEKEGLQLCISFDSATVKEAQVERLTRQFEHILQQMCAEADQSKKVKEIEMITEQDLRDIWNWNADIPKAADATVAESSSGHAMGATTWIVSTERDDLAPVGTIGELWLETPLADPKLADGLGNMAAFVVDPPWLVRGGPSHHGRRGKLFKTGDLVKYNPNSTLAFIGRKDTHAKIRGLRVDLGEVERHVQRLLTDIQSLPLPIEVVAEVVSPQATDRPILVAFVCIGNAGAQTEEEGEMALRTITAEVEARLAAILPAHMVPSVFKVVKTIPMTTTGETDRQLLREKAAIEYQEHPTIRHRRLAPTNDMEMALLEVWMQVLNLPAEAISTDSSFLRLGGDSISAMMVVSRCRSRSIAVTVGDVLRTETIRGLATRCCLIAPSRLATLITDEEDLEPWTLSPIQQMFFENHPSGLDHYNQSYLLRLTQPVSGIAVRKALQAVVSRHSMLRARFRRDDNKEWVQFLTPDGLQSLAFTEHSVQTIDEIRDLAQRRQESFKISDGPLFAADLFNSAKGEQYLFLVSHHLVIDLVSWRILWNDIETCLRTGISLLPRTVSFRQWCGLQVDSAQMLSPSHVLPFKVEAPQLAYWGLSPDENSHGECKEFTHWLDEETTTSLLSQSNDAFMTEPTDILVAMLIHSFRQTFLDRPAPPVTLEGHGREPSDDMPIDLSETVGWFTTLHPIQVPGSAGDSVVDSVKFTKDVRRRVPGKGRPYFAFRYHNAVGREEFQAHCPAELLLNYSGVFQQLESADTFFRPVRFDENTPPLADFSSMAQRSALVNVEIGVRHGRIHISFGIHRRMKHQARLQNWSSRFAECLKLATRSLTSTSLAWTLSDFPLMSLSYAGLDKLRTETLGNIGISAKAVRDIYPCTPLQEGIMLSTKKGAASYLTVLNWICHPSKPGDFVSPARLETAWRSVVDHHPILSTIFIECADEGSFFQVLLRDFDPTVKHIDSGSLSPTETLLQQQCRSFEAGRPSHVFTVCRAPNDGVACRLDISHVLMDAASIPVIVRDLVTAYGNQNLTPAPHFREFVEELQRVNKATRLEYWKTSLAGVKPCIIPIGKGLANVQDVSTGEHDDIEGHVEVSANITSKIYAFCRERSITRSAFLQVAWALVLSWFTQKEDVCFGYMASGRDVPIDNIEDMVGPLINLLVSRVHLGTSVDKVMGATSEQSIKHLDFQHTSLAEIQHALQIRSGPLFNTAMTVREAYEHHSELSGEIQLEELIGDDPHEFDLMVGAILKGSQTKTSVEYYKSRVSETLAQDICHLLSTAIEYLLKAWDRNDDKNSAMQSGRPVYSEFFEYVVGINEEQAVEFWRQYFAGSVATAFPSPVSQSQCSSGSTTFECSINTLDWSRLDVAPSTAIRAAWAILQARYTNASDVVFGATVFDGTVPIRVKFNWDETVQALLRQLQDQAVDMTPFERLGLQRIGHIGEEAEQGCQFQTLLMVHPVEKQQVAIIIERLTSLRACTTHAMMLEFQLNGPGIQLRISFNPTSIEQIQVERLVRQFEDVLQQLSAEANQLVKVKEIMTAGEEDLRDIWSWNTTVPEVSNVCVHDLITDKAQEQPDERAICAWDGNLTYGELDKLSTRLAYHLIERGVGPEHSIVPLYFEKSMWMAVAMLAVMKAGGASVAMDVTLPAERLRSIVGQVQATLILSSTSNEMLAHHLADDIEVLVAEEYLEAPGSDDGQMKLPKIDPSSLLYVIFTSGSTGTPKGTLITHRNFSSALNHQLAAFDLNESSRVYDFASYAFDVAWSNVLFTLRAGGCVCVPSEDQRRNNISESIRFFEANVLDITPKVAREVDPETMPQLRFVTLSGEMVSFEDMRRWANIRVLNVYGPAECTVTSTMGKVVPSKGEPASIGRGAGLNTWVVAPDESGLVPIGAVGELWLEGPLVGSGYLNDPDKTAAVFVEDPSWLLRGGPNHSGGRRGRLYRTGDLVRYNPNGTLVFVGRKDSQVKIRGQRVELGEVEHHVQLGLNYSGTSTTVVAEMISPHSGQDPVLVAFVAVGQALGGADAVKTKFSKVAQGLEERLAERIPAYMIPTAFVPIEEIPITATGKTDRQQLRKLVEPLTLEQLIALNPMRRGQRCSVSTETERQLQQLWANVLNCNPDTISADDSFLHVGGDSILAMRLVSAARNQGLSFTVAHVFQQPRLRDLARVAITSKPTSFASPVRFASLGMDDPEDFIQREILPQIGTTRHSISNVFPLAPYQPTAVEQALQSPPGQLYHFFMDFSSSVSISRLLSCCTKLVDHFDILRTVFVRSHGQILQVVLDKLDVPVELYETEHSVDDIFELLCTQDFEAPAQLGCSFLRFMILQGPQSTRMVFRISHAQYDGVSMSQIVDAFGAFYDGRSYPKQPSFDGFIEFANSQKQKVFGYWRSILKGSSMTSIPQRSSTLAEASLYNQALVVKNSLPALTSNSGITPAAIFTAACVDMLAAVTGSTDILFGRLVSGRAGLPAELEDVAGCCINTIPVRVRIDSSKSSYDVVESVQEQYLQGIPYETVDMSQLMNGETDDEPEGLWSGFGCVTQFQNIEEHLETEIAGSAIRLQTDERRQRAPRDSTIRIIGIPGQNELKIEVVASPMHYEISTLDNLLAELSRSLSKIQSQL